MNAIVNREILRRFGMSPTDAEICQLGRGLIHRTLLCRSGEAVTVLQSVNLDVFPDPELLAANTRRVVDCLAEAADRGEYPLEVARPLGSLVRVGEEVWRATTHIDGTYSIDRADTPERARAGAAAFGSFCAALTAIDPTELGEVLPGFHDFDARLARFEEALDADMEGRAAGANEAIEYCRGCSGFAPELRAICDALPVRVCHNDTKINNLLFDAEDHRPRAVVDLDTCMPGRWMHDFGDIVRTFCPAEDENSTKTDQVRVREDLFQAVCEGFTGPLGAHLTPDERESLWAGALTMPLMLGTRFLTDHLAGDIYFHTDRAHQNLDRARNQFALHRDLVSRENELRRHLCEKK